VNVSDADVAVLQDCLTLLEKWSVTWQLSISIKKCSILMVGSGGSDAVYSFSDQAIESVDVVKDLGVLVDSKLNFFQHISDITKKAHQRASMILRCFLTRDHSLTHCCA